MTEKPYITQQSIEKQKFSVFLRDLSKDLDLNLKHMIEDNIISKEVKEKKNKKNHYKGRKVIKKKDIIIQEQNKKRRQKDINTDYEHVDYLISNIFNLQ